MCQFIICKSFKEIMNNSFIVEEDFLLYLIYTDKKVIIYKLVKALLYSTKKLQVKLYCINTSVLKINFRKLHNSYRNITI